MTFDLLKDIIQLLLWALTVGGVVWKAATLASKIKSNTEEINDLKVAREKDLAKIDVLNSAVSEIKTTLASISTKLDMILTYKSEGK